MARMSYNIALAFLPNTAPTDIGALSPATMSFDEASDSMADGASAAVTGNNTLIVDPTMLILGPSLTPPAGSVIVALSGVADTYVVQTYGDSPRLRVFTQYEVAKTEGTPLPAESVFDEHEDPEDAHFAFFCRVAGITLDDLWTTMWAPLEPNGI